MIKKIIFLNILFNVLTSLIFVALNIRALDVGLEETFIFLAFAFGLVVTLGNALFVAYFSQKKH